MDLSTNEARVALATKWAAKYQLDPYIVCAVCEQESSWNPYAIRFEPAFEARYIKPAIPTAPSTRQLTEAVSFGLMQVMGEVAIDCGWAGKFLTELCDPDTAVDFGCRKLAQCFAKHPNNPEAALLMYNGGGNLEYGKQVLARVAHYMPSQEAD